MSPGDVDEAADGEVRQDEAWMGEGNSDLGEQDRHLSSPAAALRARAAHRRHADREGTATGPGRGAAGAARGRGRGPGPLPRRDPTATGPPSCGETFSSWIGTRSSIPAQTQRALASLEWVSRAENLIVAGPQGTGKSHLLEALGHHAVHQGLQLAWFSVEDLGAIIRRHRVDDTVSKAFGGSPRCGSR